MLTLKLAVLFTIARELNQPSSASVKKQIIKMWYIYITGYYSAVINR